MTTASSAHLFLLGEDYHLGDLLWFTAVLAEYRRQRAPGYLLVGCPDRPISRILERNPLLDEIVYGSGSSTRAAMRRRFGKNLVVHDLRMLPIALSMVRQWRRYLPWLYYRDLWLQPRGQWLATFLGLGTLADYRPVLRLVDEDRAAVRSLPDPYAVLAPHIGGYRLPLAGRFWQAMKGWPAERWSALAQNLRSEGLQPVTLGAAGQEPVPGTRSLTGLPIRQAAGIIEGAAALVTVESGLWFVAAATRTPFLIVRWWLPRSVDWAAPMQTAHRLMYGETNSVENALSYLHELTWTSKSAP
jgi:hypothetical protein